MNHHEASLHLFRRVFKKWQEDFDFQFELFVCGSIGEMQKRNAEILAMRHDGATLAEIGKTYNLSNETIRQIIARFDEQIRCYSKTRFGACGNCHDFKDENTMAYCGPCLSAKHLFETLINASKDRPVDNQ